MKTMTTTITALLIAISINVTAQVKVKPHNPKPIDYVPRNSWQNNPPPTTQNNQQQNSNHWGHGWNNGYPQGYVSLNFGYNSPYYGNPYLNSYYNNGYSMKKQTRYSIRAAGQIINQAIAFDSWNDIYSPLLAKAIRHYNFARQQYWWGNYQAAYNHAERARYLAWQSLRFFQNPACDSGYGNGYNEPNPYCDPYSPYYRSNQAGNVNSNEGNRSQEIPKNESVDSNLPNSDMNDKEVIRTFDKSEMKNE